MPSLSDELGITTSLSQELGIGKVTNVLPENIRKSMEWSTKKPIPKALDVIGDVIGTPKRALDKKLRGPGVTGTPTTPEEQLAQLRFNNPYLYPLARAAASSPAVSRKIQSMGGPAKNIVDEMNQGWLPSAAGGFLQSMINAPISVANAGLEQTNLGEIPYLDLEQYKPANTLASNLGFKGGQAGGYIAPYSAVSKVLGMARPTQGIGGLISDAVSGGATGYLLGGEGGDIGRYLGGALGAIAEPLQSLGASKIASRVAEKSDKLRKGFNKRYTALFNQAEKAGIKNINVPNAPYSDISFFTNGKWGKSMSKFLNKPSPLNAHRLQSDLGKFVNQLEKRINTTGLSSEEIIQLTKALDVQKRVRGALFKDLSQVKGLGNEYQKITQDYAKEMIPYTNKAIKEFMRGERTAEDLVQYLNTSIKGKALIKPNHPEIGINQGIKKVAPWLGYGGLGLGATNYLIDKIGGLLHGDE